MLNKLYLCFFCFLVSSNIVWGQLVLSQSSRAMNSQNKVYCLDDNLFTISSGYELIDVKPSIGEIKDLKSHSFNYFFNREIFKGKIALSIIAKDKNGLRDSSKHVLEFSRDYENFPVYEIELFPSTIKRDSLKPNLFYVTQKEIENEVFKFQFKRNGVLDTTIYYKAEGIRIIKDEKGSSVIVPFYFGTTSYVCGNDVLNPSLTVSQIMKRSNLKSGASFFVSSFRLWNRPNVGSLKAIFRFKVL
jgi:hypothetical protein